jgi:hypothetical protein
MSTSEEKKVKLGAKRYTVVRESDTKKVLRILAVDSVGWRPIDQSGKLGKRILLELATADL